MRPLVLLALVLGCTASGADEGPVEEPSDAASRSDAAGGSSATGGKADAAAAPKDGGAGRDSGGGGASGRDAVANAGGSAILAPLYGLLDMARFDLLPAFKAQTVGEVSSADPTGGNYDSNHFVADDGNGTVTLADIDGPGSIDRIWCTDMPGYGGSLTGQVRIYLDGETTPRIDCPFQDLFDDKCPPFRSPLSARSSGGFSSYFPITFAKHVKIDVNKPGTYLYYQITYRTYPAGAAVPTFTKTISAVDRQALDNVIANWNGAGQAPEPMPASPVARQGSVSLAPGAEQTFLDESAPGTIRVLRIAANPALTSSADLELRAFWDGETTPSIQAPVIDFFGYGFGDTRYDSLTLAMRSDGYYAFWPMPYGRSAKMSLVNTGTVARTVSWEAQIDPSPPDMSTMGFFHAVRQRATTQKPTPVTLANLTGGRGHFVGVSANMSNPTAVAEDLGWAVTTSGFMEGDYVAHVDGRADPTLNGTGAEDYFNGGFYFYGVFASPLHGSLLVDKSDKARYSAYRWHVTDSVPFTQSFVLTTEHGPTNDYYAGIEYFWTVYFYQ